MKKKKKQKKIRYYSLKYAQRLMRDLDIQTLVEYEVIKRSKERLPPSPKDFYGMTSQEFFRAAVMDPQEAFVVVQGLFKSIDCKSQIDALGFMKNIKAKNFPRHPRSTWSEKEVREFKELIFPMITNLPYEAQRKVIRQHTGLPIQLDKGFGRRNHWTAGLSRQMRSM